MTLISVKFEETDNVVRVEISMGYKAVIGNSYAMTDVGALTMSVEDWDSFRSTLVRGAKRPVLVVIEKR